MTNTLSNISTAQLRQAVEIREQIDRLEAELVTILNGETPSPGRTPSIPVQRTGKKAGMSAEGRARIVAAQKARWANFHTQKSGGKASIPPTTKPKRKMSSAARARIAAAAKARWAKAKAAGKTRL
jgi:hypothetical protein